MEEMDPASSPFGEGEIEVELPRSIDRNEVEDMEEQSFANPTLR